jgi:ribosome-binding ATPase YchF (GTP1/OBG family)
VEGEVNPVRDIEIINDELRLKDIDMLAPNYDKIKTLVTRGEKKYKVEFVRFFAASFVHRIHNQFN